MSSQLQQLREALAEVEDLRHAAAVAEWDQQTQMPPRGGAARAEVLATLEKVAHEKFAAASVGRLLEGAAAELESAGRQDPSDDDVALVTHTRRVWEKARRVPTELAAELARAASLGQEVWVRARTENDFGAFAPVLSHQIELKRRYVECFEGFACAYDALLDDYEPQMKTAQVAALFTELRDALVPLIEAVSQRELDDSILHGHFPVEDQRRLVREVISLQGWNAEGWRLDDAAHPFATSFANSDVRITDRWDERYFPSSLYGAMHETGHGLYEAGIADALMRTPLGHGVSLGVHESQSRLWENMVGRGRPFAQVLSPRVVAVFGGALSDLSPERLFRAVNRVGGSLIRVEADEATYSLHVIIRFELEQALIEGRLAVADLPEAWNAKYRDYLGIEVPSDADGVLQDVHWSAGLFGYFSTYALGNLIAGQLWRQAHLDLGDLDAQIAAGELAGLREWLRVNVHHHGAKYLTPDLLHRVVGTGIEVGPFVDYLTAKLSDVYELTLA
ncbi:MAG TPA: carboxypeptidase M32 [Solirubrobacteraceae bacterium]|nr:carboxypeptidase M32 [Solirubrobacteraceae bacterium]